MKKILTVGLIAASALIALGIILIYYENTVAPRLSAQSFCELWKQRLGAITDLDKIPVEWRDTVYIRHFEDGWIAAAFYHGSCTQSGAKSFNASVFRDSLGHIIAYPGNSPCASGIKDIGQFWEYLSPAKTLSEYNRKYKDGPPKGG